MSEYRIEHDSMGEVHVPAQAYYGAQTQRAAENFFCLRTYLKRQHCRLRNPTQIPNMSHSQTTLQIERKVVANGVHVNNFSNGSIAKTIVNHACCCLGTVWPVVL